MLRQNVAEGTELGAKAAAIMAAGDLVPDDLVVAMVAERLSRDDAACGYILDGFPRNEAQAIALDAEVGDGALETVVLLEADSDELVARLLGRAAELGRSDDNEDTVRRRLEVYEAETEPLIRYYPTHDVPISAVDGMGTIDEVFSRIVVGLAGDPE